MRRSFLALLLVTVAVGAALAYQAATRDRDYRALVARGETALREDQTFGAIEAFSGAIALRPDSMLSHLRRGETYLRRGDRGDLDQAARDFRAAASIDTAAPRPLEELGDVLYQLRRYDQSAETYARYLRLDDRSPGVSYKLALAYYTAGDLDAATNAVTQTLRLDARMADAHYLMGMCLRDKHRTTEAIAAFERAVALAPDLIPAREELAESYAAAGRPADELTQLQALAGLDRSHAERLTAVGLAQARAGHAELAVLTLSHALERMPDQPVIYGALGRVWLDIAETRHDAVDLSKALEALGRAAGAPGASSETLTLYGRALLRDGQSDAAERTLSQAATTYPLDPAALTWYATAAERQSHLDAARKALLDYETLVDDDGQFVGRATRIASLSLRLRDRTSAADWIRRGLEREPANAALLALARRLATI